MSDIVLFGTGQIADVARVYIDAHGPDRIIGFVVDDAFRTGDTFAGRPQVSWEDLERTFPPERVKLLGPVSFRKLNGFRRSRFEEGKARGYGFATFVHPNCSVYTDRIGENCFILENNTLQPFVEIGDNVILWSNNHIGHHSKIGAHSFVSSQCGISSNVTIGEECFLGGKASIDYGCTIGDRCFLGPSVGVGSNLPAETVVPGVPSPLARYSSRRLLRFF